MGEKSNLIKGLIMTNNIKLNKTDLSLVKKALRICIVKFHFKGERHSDIDSRILANKFEKVYGKLKSKKSN